MYLNLINERKCKIVDISTLFGSHIIWQSFQMEIIH